jgi:hypothetical protein
MARRLAVSLVFALAALVYAGLAAASGGNYVFDRGTPAEQTQVREALSVSSFNWSLVPTQITIHIVRGIRSQSSPGQIWLDADLLDGGVFSWGVVQHEYAHQVDFFLLDSAKRATLEQALGGRDWCYGIAGLPHSAYGCERFASTLAWSYWPSPDNSMKPQSSADESAAMTPAEFRAVVAQLVAVPQVTSIQSAEVVALAPKLRSKPRRGATRPAAGRSLEAAPTG